MGKEWPHSKEEAVVSSAYLVKGARKKQFTEENGHPEIVPRCLSCALMCVPWEKLPRC